MGFRHFNMFYYTEQIFIVRRINDFASKTEKQVHTLYTGTDVKERFRMYLLLYSFVLDHKLKNKPIKLLWKLSDLRSHV